MAWCIFFLVFGLILGAGLGFFAGCMVAIYKSDKEQGQTWRNSAEGDGRTKGKPNER
jgi:hypothetical protein